TYLLRLPQSEGRRKAPLDPCSGMRRHVVPRRAETAEPVERAMPLPGDRLGFRALLGREVSVDGAEGGEVAAQGSRQESPLVAAHDGRGDQVAGRLPALKQR